MCLQNNIVYFYLLTNISRRTPALFPRSATLISNCHVVTAAHCVEDRSFDVTGIYVNAHTPYQGNSGHPFFFSTAQRVSVPEDYDDYTNVNDVAVMRMNQCLDVQIFKPAVPASPSNSQNIQDDTMLELYGFGRLGENKGSSGDTKQLQVANLPYISGYRCRMYFGNKIKEGMFCAGYPETGGVDACQGDSGSGILKAPSLYSDDPAIFVGVVSWVCLCLGFIFLLPYQMTSAMCTKLASAIDREWGALGRDTRESTPKLKISLVGSKPTYAMTPIWTNQLLGVQKTLGPLLPSLLL